MAEHTGATAPVTKSPFILAKITPQAVPIRSHQPTFRQFIFVMVVDGGVDICSLLIQHLTPLDYDSQKVRLE